MSSRAWSVPLLRLARRSCADGTADTRDDPHPPKRKPEKIFQKCRAWPGSDRQRDLSAAALVVRAERLAVDPEACAQGEAVAHRRERRAK